MRFDERQYPDPAAMMSELHKQNLHLVISVWAKFGAETAVNREMQASHLVLTSAASTAEPGETQEAESWADLFNPKAQKAFWSDIDRNLFSLGLDGWWLDASEPEGDPLKKDVTFLGPGVGVRNAFPLFETSAVYKGQRAATEDKRVVILSRSAYAGQQRNGSSPGQGISPAIGKVSGGRFPRASTSECPAFLTGQRMWGDSSVRPINTHLLSIANCWSAGSSSERSAPSSASMDSIPKPRCGNTAAKSKIFCSNTTDCGIACCPTSIPRHGASRIVARS